MLLWGLRWRLISPHTAPSTQGSLPSVLVLLPCQMLPGRELSRVATVPCETTIQDSVLAVSSYIQASAQHRGDDATDLCGLAPLTPLPSCSLTAILPSCQKLVPCPLTHILFQTTEPCWKLNKHHVPAFPRHLFCKYLLNTDDMECTGWPEINLSSSV